MKRVMITGGRGHVGAWTARKLIDRGEYRVLLVDRSGGVPEAVAEHRKHVDLGHADVLDTKSLSALFEEFSGEIDGIVHTPAILGENVLTAPRESIELNVMGLVNVLEMARRYKIGKVIYVSSGAVYATGKKEADEEWKTDPPDLYSATKRSAELLCLHFGASFDIDVRVGRLYFIYGPGKLPSSFVRLYQLAFGALEGLSGLSSERGADQRLDFTYVEDAAGGLAALYDKPTTEHRIYNIATGVASSVGEAVSLSRKYSHFDSDISVGPGTLVERVEALNVGRMINELGYESQTSLEEGIRTYAEWLRGVKNGTEPGTT